jgi:hypothetical protein
MSEVPLHHLARGLAEVLEIPYSRTRHSLTVGSYQGATSYERGTPVGGLAEVPRELVRANASGESVSTWLSSEYSTCKTVEASLWHWLSGKSVKPLQYTPSSLILGALSPRGGSVQDPVLATAVTWQEVLRRCRASLCVRMRAVSLCRRLCRGWGFQEEVIT